MRTETTRRYFTQAAREAALAVRLANRKLPGDFGRPEVFVIRMMLPGAMFGWEIRRFGALVLHRSEMGYAVPALARAAGEQALAELGSS